MKTLKKFVGVLLSVMICASLMACGKGNSDYDDLIQMLEKGEYESAHYYIDNLKRKAEEASSEGKKEESLLPFLYGEWKIISSGNEENAPELITFQEDSTCTIGTDTLKWRVTNDSANNLNGKISEGETVKYSFDISMYAENGEASLSLYHVTDDASGSSEQLGNYRNLSLCDAVEITADNWSDYFEVKEEGYFSENAFGEVESFSLNKNIVLKEEYQKKLCLGLSDLAMELDFTYGKIGCKVDMKNKTYTLSDNFKKDDYEHDSQICTFSNYDNGYMASLRSSHYNEDEKCLTGYTTDMKIIRVQGAIYLLK